MKQRTQKIIKQKGLVPAGRADYWLSDDEDLYTDKQLNQIIAENNRYKEKARIKKSITLKLISLLHVIGVAGCLKVSKMVVEQYNLGYDIIWYMTIVYLIVTMIIAWKKSEE